MQQPVNQTENLGIDITLGGFTFFVSIMASDSEAFQQLESTLLHTNAQLNEIRKLISEETTDPSDVEQLKQVESDLVELIELTEAQLLDLRKSELLAQLEKKYDSSAESSSDLHSDSLEEFLTQLDGQKCSAPFKTHLDAQLQYHNCVIFDVDMDTEEIADVAEVKVKVLFTQPIVDKMRPCGYFLDEKCRFTAETCKFSHGYEVEFGQLQEYNEPEFSELSENLNCLALGSDDLWHLAEVESICRDEMRLSVKFLTTGRQVALEFCQVFPIPKILVCTEETPEVFRFSSQNATFPSTSCTSSTSQPIGQWETHTRAIASKLMAKMGYQPGQGLGKTSQGRIDPIESRILPKGKSLDFVMENVKKPTGQLSKGQKRRAAQKLRKIAEGYKVAPTKPEVDGVFDFLNSKLTQNSTKHTANAIQPNSNNKQMKSASSQELNIKVLKLSEKLKAAEKSREQLVRSLGRAEAHSSAPQRVLANQIRHRIQQSDDQINRIKSELTQIDREQNSRKDQRKISHF